LKEIASFVPLFEFIFEIRIADEIGLDGFMRKCFFFDVLDCQDQLFFVLS